MSRGKRQVPGVEWIPVGSNQWKSRCGRFVLAKVPRKRIGGVKPGPYKLLSLPSKRVVPGSEGGIGRMEARWLAEKVIEAENPGEDDAAWKPSERAGNAIRVGLKERARGIGHAPTPMEYVGEEPGLMKRRGVSQTATFRAYRCPACGSGCRKWKTNREKVVTPYCNGRSQGLQRSAKP